DPATGTWSPTGSMAVPRHDFTMTLLPDGTVLAAGGGTTSYTKFPRITEIYHPDTGAWTTTGRMAAGRGWLTASLLRDGTVLVVGGYDGGEWPIDPAYTAEIYDPPAGRWRLRASMLAGRSSDHTETLLRD